MKSKPTSKHPILKQTLALSKKGCVILISFAIFSAIMVGIVLTVGKIVKLFPNPIVGNLIAYGITIILGCCSFIYGIRFHRNHYLDEAWYTPYLVILKYVSAEILIASAVSMLTMLPFAMVSTPLASTTSKVEYAVIINTVVVILTALIGGAYEMNSLRALMKKQENFLPIIAFSMQLVATVIIAEAFIKNVMFFHQKNVNSYDITKLLRDAHGSYSMLFDSTLKLASIAGVLSLLMLGGVMIALIYQKAPKIISKKR